MIVKELIVISRKTCTAKIIEQGILVYEGVITEIPEEYRNEWINEIYVHDNSLIVEL